MKFETQPFDIEAKVRQDCYNRGYEQGRKNPAEEIVKYIEKLQNQVKEYQDKIEQGKMIELPCKVGDTIYVIRKNGIEEREVRRFHIGRGGWYAVYYGTTLWDSCDRLGKAWFFTREEAEKKLKELQNG